MKEEEMNNGFEVDTCVASYNIDGGDKGDAVVVKCAVGGKKKVDEMSAIFPKRIWDYKRAHSKGEKKNKEKKEKTDKKESGGNGATNNFLSVGANMLVFTTTLLIV